VTSSSTPNSRLLERLIELSDTSEAARERQRVARGELPPRYADRWAVPFLAQAFPALKPNARILDIGSGRRPTIARELLPEGTEYIGMDIDRSELLAAPAGAYDDYVVADVNLPIDVVGPFDLIMGWQVLEHVRSLADTVANLRALLAPGGRLVFIVSGRYSAFALLSRFMPHRLRVYAMARLIKSDPDTKFPTVYDRCYASALERVLEGFADFTILPRYKAAVYFSFWRPLERLYLAYENLLEATDRRDLATHYVVVAIR
jgi:SAM-dependent methyltransferase